MATREGLQFTDEEIQAELYELGFAEMSADMFELLKADLANAIQQEEERNRISLSSSSQEFCADRSQESSSSGSRLDVSYRPHPERKSIPKEDAHEGDVTEINMQKRPTRAYSASEKENKFSGSITPSAEEKMIKRKTLRHSNGQPVISEEFRPAPDFSIGSGHSSRSSLSRSKSNLSERSSRQSGSRSKSVSSENLAWQQLSSASSSSVSSTSKNGRQSRQSGVLPNMNIKAKKCDPVTRYHQYRKFWEMFKPPGEENHKSLRWTVRERMLDYDFA